MARTKAKQLKDPFAPGWLLEVAADIRKETASWPKWKRDLVDTTSGPDTIFVPPQTSIHIPIPEINFSRC